MCGRSDFLLGAAFTLARVPASVKTGGPAPCKPQTVLPANLICSAGYLYSENRKDSRTGGRSFWSLGKGRTPEINAVNKCH